MNCKLIWRTLKLNWYLNKCPFDILNFLKKRLVRYFKSTIYTTKSNFWSVNRTYERQFKSEIESIFFFLIFKRDLKLRALEFECQTFQIEILFFSHIGLIICLNRTKREHWQHTNYYIDLPAWLKYIIGYWNSNKSSFQTLLRLDGVNWLLALFNC